MLFRIQTVISLLLMAMVAAPGHATCFGRNNKPFPLGMPGHDQEENSGAEKSDVEVGDDFDSWAVGYTSHGLSTPSDLSLSFGQSAPSAFHQHFPDHTRAPPTILL